MAGDLEGPLGRQEAISARLTISPECIRCTNLAESYVFFHCSAIRPLCKLLEGYMVRLLNGKFYM